MKLTTDDAFKKYADHVFAAAFSVCQNPADADDVVQDTFIKYHSERKEFSDDEHIKAWLLRVAINRAKDIRASFWRKNRVAWEEYMAELEFEIQISSRPEQNRMALMLFMAGISILPFDTNAAMEYGDIRHKLKEQGMLIGGNDLLIAAHARSLGITLVTHNTREFSSVENLRIEDWAV